MILELQGLAADGLGRLADFLPLGYAFGAGMVSTANPCGFAMLPAYLSLYLGGGEAGFRQRSPWLRAGRALVVTVAMAAGFVLLFTAIGMVVSAGGALLMDAVPWVSLAIGAGLVALGLWLLLGGRVSAGFLGGMAARIGDPREVSLRGFFLFGVAFGVTSLSCTLPVFLVVVGSAATAGGWLSGLSQFLGYGLGMAAVLLVLTLSAALLQEGFVVGRLRRVQRFVHPVTAALLILAGGYIVYYWLFVGGLIETLV